MDHMLLLKISYTHDACGGEVANILFGLRGDELLPVVFSSSDGHTQPKYCQPCATLFWSRTSEYTQSLNTGILVGHRFVPFVITADMQMISHDPRSPNVGALP